MFRLRSGVALLTLCSLGHATDIYFASTAAGSNNGTSCANAYAYNDGINGWNTAGKQAPGNFLHVCGTITGALNATLITFTHSGSSGSPITLIFESGAILQDPASNLNGIINCNGSNWITIDGGTNGVVQNTANGTSLTNTQNAYGIHLGGCSNTEIKNLTVRQIYINNNETSTTAGETGCIFYAGTYSNNNVHNNTVADCRYGVMNLVDTASNITLAYNTISDTNQSLCVFDNNSGSSASNVLIHDNTMSNYVAWTFNFSAYHQDGVMLSMVNAGSSLTGAQVYNNYWTGDMTNTGTAYIFLIGPISASYIFNNVIVQVPSRDGTYPESHIVLSNLGGPPFNDSIYNNTFVFNGTMPGPSSYTPMAIRLRGTNVNTGIAFENNIVVLTDVGNYFNSGDAISTQDHNVYYGLTSWVWRDNSTNYDTLAAWRTFCSCDANTVTTDPKFSGTYTLLSGSAAIGLGANLTSLGIAALNSDKAGVGRPSSGAWDAGAYQFIPAGATVSGGFTLSVAASSK